MVCQTLPTPPSTVCRPSIGGEERRDVRRGRPATTSSDARGPATPCAPDTVNGGWRPLLRPPRRPGQRLRSGSLPQIARRGCRRGSDHACTQHTRQRANLRTRQVVSRHLPSTCRLGAQASCTPDEPEPALTSARGSMIAGSLERTDKMPARTEEQLLFGSGALSSSGRVGGWTRGEVFRGRMRGRWSPARASEGL